MRKPPTSGTSDVDTANTPRTEQVSRNRAQILGVLLTLPFLVLVGRLWYLQIAHGEEFLHDAQSNRTRILRVGAPRGLIYDADGVLLASNRPQFAVYAVPAVAKRPDVVRRIANLLDMTPTEVVDILESEKRNNYSPVRLALNVPMAVITRVEEDRPYLAGVSSAPEPVRWYPRTTLLANTLGSLARIDTDTYKLKRGMGYFPDDFIGKAGLERQYERELHGTPGGTLVEVKARGTDVVNLGQIDPIPGKTLRLTIKRDLQTTAEAVLKEHQWTGAAVAIDPNTGAVLAMASAPTYDPNAFATGINVDDWAKIRGNPEKPMINRSVDSLYPPGSTFKQVVAAAALEDHAVNLSTTYYCSGIYNYDKRSKFGCWAIHGPTDFYKAVADSCDVYFYHAGLSLGADEITRIASQYPLGKFTGIDLPHEMIGTIPNPTWKQHHFRKFSNAWRRWYPGDTINMSIGQGFVLTTPLQIALTTAATANGGDVYKPYLVDSIDDPISGLPVSKTVPTLLNHVPVKPENLDAVREGMRQCVTMGTGKIVNFKGLRVGAKTGSSQATGSKITHGWFVAFAPYDHPTIAVAAIVERGGHGGKSAGKVVRAMLQTYFKLGKDAGGEAAASD
ncbi:MAG TPA: penicillin-binding protein 2 [Capsulimonadaceae bacterium]|jgi:penicillin-binding protein 2